METLRKITLIKEIEVALPTAHRYVEIKSKLQSLYDLFE